MTADAAAKNPSAVAGTVSVNANAGRSGRGPESNGGHQDKSSSGSHSSIRSGFYQLGIWLSVIFTGLVLVPLVIWAVVRSVRSQEESQNGEVVYSNLNVLQVYGKIAKKS